MPKKRTVALFDRICVESVKPLCVIRVRAGHVWLFSSNIHAKKAYKVFFFNAHAKKAYIYTYLIEYTTKATLKRTI